jgi:hypothetical protein
VPITLIGSEGRRGRTAVGIHPSDAGEAVQPVMAAERTHDGFRIQIAVADDRWTISLPDTGNAMVEP